MSWNCVVEVCSGVANITICIDNSYSSCPLSLERDGIAFQSDQIDKKSIIYCASALNFCDKQTDHRSKTITIKYHLYS